MKKIKWNSIVISLVYIALGILLAIRPDIDANVVCLILASAIVLMGLVSIVRYFTFDIEGRFLRNDFVSGLMIVVAGAMIYLYKDEMKTLLNVALGAMILVSGFEKLRDCLDIIALGYGSPLLYIVLVLVNLGMGFMTILNIIPTQNIMFVFVGVSLIYSGLSDLFSSIYLSIRRGSYLRRKREEKEAELSQQPLNAYEPLKDELIASEQIINNVADDNKEVQS